MTEFINRAYGCLLVSVEFRQAVEARGWEPGLPPGGGGDKLPHNQKHRRKTVQGVVFTGDRQIELMTFPDPTPGPGEVDRKSVV